MVSAIKERLETGATVVLVACALVVTALVLRREFFGTALTSGRSQVVTVPDWRSYSETGQVMGPTTASVRLVVFSDFQCPYCKILADDLNTLRQRDSQRFAIVYRHFPGPAHRYAAAAARASECAAAQGRFEAFHNALFAEQQAIGRVSWTHFATVAGLHDSTAFNRCQADSASVPALRRDTVDGNRLGIQGTPTFLVNDVAVRGAPGLEALEGLINRSARSSPPR